MTLWSVHISHDKAKTKAQNKRIMGKKNKHPMNTHQNKSQSSTEVSKTIKHCQSQLKQIEINRSYRGESLVEYKLLKQIVCTNRLKK